MDGINVLPKHRYTRIAGLRAAVLGANDGILSLSSLILGVASSHAQVPGLMVIGVAGLLSGTLAMAAGEYVSVRSQADAEAAEIEVERVHLDADFIGERAELAAIYAARGLSEALAEEVAGQLLAHDALGAHARDELGLSDTLRARPLLAALSSGISFALGGLVPLLAASSANGAWLYAATAIVSLASLAILGAVAARAGGANPAQGAVRVALWGAVSMAVTSIVGALLGSQLVW